MADVINTFATSESKAVNDLVDALNRLRLLALEYEKRGLNGIITDDDLTGSNDHITALALANVFNTLTVITSAIDGTGHLNNLYAVLPFDDGGIT